MKRIIQRLASLMLPTVIALESGALAQALPDVVNRMTPQGQIPDGDNDLVSQALAILQQRRGG